MIRGNLLAIAEVKGVTIEATITRADGTVERYGVIAGWRRSRIGQLLMDFRIMCWRLRRAVKWRKQT